MFTMLSHGTSKDILILGSTEDVQVVMRSTLMQAIVKQQHCFRFVIAYPSCLCVCFCVKVLLDDSIIRACAVASSCFVVRIKQRVDKLLRQLILFNQTLVKAIKKRID